MDVGVPLDLMSQDSVRSFAADVDKRFKVCAGDMGVWYGGGG